jgi:hypothetical protein
LSATLEINKLHFTISPHAVQSLMIPTMASSLIGALSTRPEILSLILCSIESAAQKFHRHPGRR